MLENTRPCSSASGRYSEPRCRRQIGLSTFYTWTYSMCLSVPVTCGNEQILTDIYNVKICVIIAFYWQKPMDRRLGKSEKQCRIYDSDLKCALQPDLWVHQVCCATQVNFSVPLVKWTGVCLCLCQRVVNVPVYCLPVRLCETWVLFVRNTHLLPLYLYCIYYCLWIVEVHLWGQSNALSLLIDDPQSIKIYTLELFKHKCGLFFPLQSKTHCSKEMKGPENSRANTNNGFWPAFVSVLVVGNRRWYVQPIQAAQVVQLLCAVPTIDRAGLSWQSDARRSISRFFHACHMGSAWTLYTPL